MPRRVATALLGCAAVMGMGAVGAGVIGPAKAADAGIYARWLIESVTDAGTIDTGKAYLSIARDGKVATTVGCNRMMSSATIDGTAISFSPIAGTRMACPEPLMKQEYLYTAALEATRTFALKGTTLTFFDATGAALVVFAKAREPAPE